MRIIGCDLHARQQVVAMLDTNTGELMEITLTHEGNNVREFYSKLPRPVRVGIEATGSMQWFVNLTVAGNLPAHRRGRSIQSSGHLTKQPIGSDSSGDVLSLR